MSWISFLRESVATFERIFYKLTDKTWFWVWVFMVTLLWTRAIVLDKILSNLEDVNHTTQIIAAAVIGYLANQGKH